jgi:hypothetical protein
MLETKGSSQMILRNDIAGSRDPSACNTQLCHGETELPQLELEGLAARVILREEIRSDDAMH